MLYAKDFRKIARDILAKGKWGIAIVVTLIATLLGAKTGGSFPSNTWKSGNGWFDKSDSGSMENLKHLKSMDFDIPVAVVTAFLIVLLIAFCIGLAIFIIGSAIEVGYRRFCLNLIDEKEAGFGDVFSAFDIFGKAVGLRFLIALYVFLGLLLCIVPGIIFAYSYSQATTILAEHPDMKITEVMQRSKELMNGNKIRLFCLEISFIGWALLAALTCNIGSVVLSPYINLSKAAFYREITSNRYSNPEVIVEAKEVNEATEATETTETDETNI